MTEKISEAFNLQKAYTEVISEERSGQGFLPDILCFLDTKKYKASVIRELKLKLDNDEFQAEDLVKMDIPKDSFLIRPGGRPCLRDWVLYHALSMYIGLKTDRKLGKNIFSSRFDHKRNSLIHWIDQWLNFERAFWIRFEQGFRYVLKTDITSYFVNINVDRLRKCVIDLIDSSAESDGVIHLLFDKLLRRWAEKERNQGFGLPQGTDASRVLANLFLTHIDAILSRDKGIQYLRYSDDIRILAKTEVEAKIALKKLAGELSRIGLDLNEKKTQILDPERVELELRDPRRQDMDTIHGILVSSDENLIKKIAMPLLRDLFDRSFDSNNSFGNRHLRFCVSCFIRLRGIYDTHSSDIRDVGLKLVAKLASRPGSANVFSRFFKAFPQENLKKALVKFLRGNDNIYEWQEMNILDALLRCSAYNQRELSIFRSIAFDRDKHPLTRARAILLLGKFGNGHQRYELTTKFNEETDYLVKRAILVATQEHSVAERNDFYTTVKRTDPEHAQLVDYLKSLREPVYFDERVPAPISVVEEQY